MSKTKILIYDIETAPNLGYIWGKWQQDVIEYTHEWYMLCWSARWLGEKKIHTFAQPDSPGDYYKKRPFCDYHVVASLWNLMNEADIIVAHNGKFFDNRKSNARFLYHGFEPPAPYKTIDTYKEAKKYFSFNSYRLNDLAHLLGIGTKAQTGGFRLWKECMQGKKRAWNKMKKYNRQDVALLEEVYYKLRPWMETHPTVNLIEGKEGGCPACGSTSLTKQGIYRAKTQVYQQWKCKGCGRWSRSRKAKETPKAELV